MNELEMILDKVDEILARGLESGEFHSEQRTKQARKLNTKAIKWIHLNCKRLAASAYPVGKRSNYTIIEDVIDSGLKLDGFGAHLKYWEQVITGDFKKPLTEKRLARVKQFVTQGTRAAEQRAIIRSRLE